MVPALRIFEEILRQDLYGVRFELARGANLYATDEAGRTPLHLAALECHHEVVELLLKSGAPIDAMDPRGETPLHYAARAANIEAARLLLRAGADTARKNQQGRCPTQIGPRSWRKLLMQTIFAELHESVEST